MIYGRELPGYPYNLKAKLTRCIIWAQRLIFGRYLSRYSDHTTLDCAYVGQDANNAIKSLLASGKPCFVARFGSGEIECTMRGVDIASKEGFLKKSAKLLCGKSGPFWWDNSIRAGITYLAGYFPETDDALNAFSERVVSDMREIDILGSWLEGEKRLFKRYCPDVVAVPLHSLTPFFFADSWMTALKGRKVLVIHPFSDTIKMQYAKRRELFSDPDALPDFDLCVYRSVQSAMGLKTPYKTWFDAMDRMCSDISKIDFDTAIIGAGAYGMSIGAFIKRDLKKQALHLGGLTQMCFGIKGSRWDAWPQFSKYYNSVWTRPLDHERPENYKSAEGGAYW